MPPPSCKKAPTSLLPDVTYAYLIAVAPRSAWGELGTGKSGEAPEPHREPWLLQAETAETATVSSTEPVCGNLTGLRGLIH